MIFRSEGIVLRCVKYRDTSAVITVYTQLFGLQSYLVNGVYGSGKKFKGQIYQPGSLVDMEMYHNPLKNLQRIKEISWAKVYRRIFSEVSRYAGATLIIEIVLKSINQEEKNEKLFFFIKDTLLNLDEASHSDAANIPLWFAARFPLFLGFEIKNNYDARHLFFDIREGSFTTEENPDTPFADSRLNECFSKIINSDSPQSLGRLPFNGNLRKNILLLLEQYYRWHLDGFSELKTLRMSVFQK